MVGVGDEDLDQTSDLRQTVRRFGPGVPAVVTSPNGVTDASENRVFDNRNATGIEVAVEPFGKALGDWLEFFVPETA